MSCFVILVAVFVLIIASLPSMRYVDPSTNSTKELEVFTQIDIACVCWFSTEWLLRVWAAPGRVAYMLSAMSIVDLMAVSPFYIEAILLAYGQEITNVARLQSSMLIVRILRIMRIFRGLRVLRVARYSTGMNTMGNTIMRSWRELTMMVLFMATTNIVFSTAIYFLEGFEEGTQFTSIPAAAWWCIITMTTVGYGDLIPQTVVGKLVASIASITGILLLAFPISVVVQNFDDVYNSEIKAQQTKEKEEQKSPNGPKKRKLKFWRIKGNLKSVKMTDMCD